MAIAKNEPTITRRTEYEYEVIKRSFLFGIIKWEEKNRMENLGTDLFITSAEDIRSFYVNGKKYVLKE